ncbi:MAG: VRR-NUC domain-containing protein [Peptococcaceae bacterium]|nr:VRR-NUC domain-containing protein [Peptococcaceae bacterium]
MREQEIEQKLRDAVKSMGGRAYKFISPGNVGVPDRIVIMPGRQVIFVELKTEVGRLTPVQKAQIGYLEVMGQDVRVLYGLSDVEQFIDELART